MATQELLQVYGTQVMFADFAGDFDNPTDPTAANYLVVGTPTEIQMDMGAVAEAGARQSDKTATLAKTGSAWPMEWVFGACMEGAPTPDAGATYDFYWNSSPSATPGTANSGGCSGADAAYTEAGESQLIRIGSLVCVANVINISTNIGTIWLPHLYGSLVMYNNSGAAVATDVDQVHVTMTPIIPDAQAAA